ncbi:hypothetical protein V8G54_034995 [Vigna mungo]|uniref:Uncharacterized protein n=1 Tax=Vigna mungo TaxID=3915 RepID=A0AAQ3ME71_VIGMU
MADSPKRLLYITYYLIAGQLLKMSSPWCKGMCWRFHDKGAVALVYSKYSYKVNSELKYGTESYCMEYYFETNNNGNMEIFLLINRGKFTVFSRLEIVCLDNGNNLSACRGKPGTADWRSGFHDLQLCFGVKEFLVISPKSVSSTVLDAPERQASY